MYSSSRLNSVRNITMNRQLESSSFVFRVFIGSVIIAIGFVVLTFLLSQFDESSANMQIISLPYDIYSANGLESSNVVTASFANITSEANLTALQIKDGASKSARGTQSVFVNGSKTVAKGVTSGAKVTANTVGDTIGFIGDTTGKGVSIVANIPGDAINSVTNTAIMKNIIRPSEYEEVALIDPNSPELLAALAVMPPKPENTNQPQPITETGPIWPINGRITTKFGVPHWPYQNTHTGLDISDGKRSGVTPIKPFRSGKVIETIKSRRGYGNHIIIDHGNGITSVYAHLASITAKVGQEVTIYDSIGTEGSTGMSTGTHLHFEIRVNGKAANPFKFIVGQP